MDPTSNDYSLQELLGEGSFSRVFKIQHKRTGVMYAGKHLKKLFNGKQDIISCTEINIMKRIEDHPNILNLKDLICNTFPCNIILVFDLMDMNLYEYFSNKQRPLSESWSRTIFYQIVSGIQHLHKNGVFHRDVKPENVLLKFPKTSNCTSQECKQVIVKLADFGSAKSIEMDFPLTAYVATRWYRAPECLMTNGYYGPKMDVWSVGCIFYEMLTLRPLFPGNNELDQLDQIHKILGSPTESVLRRFRHLKPNIEFQKINPVKFSTLIPHLSKLGLSVIKACLSYLPDTRIDSTRLQNHYYFRDVRKTCNTPKSSRSDKSSARSLLGGSSSKLLNPVKIPRPTPPMTTMQLRPKRRDGSNFSILDKANVTNSKRQRK